MVAAVDWHIVWSRIFHPDQTMLLALERTIYISVAAQLIGVLLGLAAALARMSRLRLLRLVSGLYVLVIRGTPVIVPPLGNEFNNMMKTTSLLAFVGVYELFQDADVHYSTTFKPVEYFLAVACWYLLLTSVWALIQVQIERRLAASERTDELSLRNRLVTAWTPVQTWARGAL